MRRLVAMASLALAVAISIPTPAGASRWRDEMERRAASPPKALEPTGQLGHAWAGVAPYVAGATVFSRGELIHQDRPFDDSGASTIDDSDLVAARDVYDLCSTGAQYRHGEATYPNDAALRANAADLVEVRIASEPDAWHVLFQLQTLVDPAKTVVRLGVDADGIDATGQAGWPGFEHVLEVTGSSGRLNGTPVTARADAARNLFEARVPKSAVPARTWRVAASAGLVGGAEMDVAFVDEPITGVFNCWQDLRQSQHMAAGRRPSATVDARELGVRDDPPLAARGALLRLYAPTFDVGEGVRPQPRYSGTTIYGGSLQPYTAYVPESYDAAKPAPLLMLLHCLNCNHNVFHIAAWPGLAALAEETGSIIVTPLAYGEGGHYQDEAEIDVLEVLGDVLSRYAVDRDRISLTGMSMGALGTFRLGLLYPDLWARALGVGNYTADICVSPSQRYGCAAAPVNYFTILGNARNVTWGLVNGALDELTPITSSREIADRFRELGYAHRLWALATRRHEPSIHGDVVDLVAPFFREARRVATPARVTYAVDRAMDNPAMGLVHERAYWLRDIRRPPDAARSEVDAALGAPSAAVTTDVSASGTSPAGGPWVLSGLDVRVVPPSDRSTLALRLRGVGSLAIDTAAAGIPRDAPLTVTVDSDREARVDVAGFGVVAARAGTTTVRLDPARAVEPARGEPAPASRESLPATGGGASGALSAGLLVAALAIRRLACIARSS